MKYLYTTLLLLAAVILGGANTAKAAASPNNPQVVAYYLTGSHGIVGEYYLHEGKDVVMRAGNSGNFQQWFYGTSAEGVHGDHSVWKISKNGTCSDGAILVPNASASWGDYLVHGADYCVKTNDFHVQN